MRIGQGYDVHKLVEGRKLILGGIEIPSKKGLLGHSDADVLIHAIMDAMLGALALGDIGKHFPDTDPKFKGISSITLLKHVNELILSYGWKISNLDSTVVLQAPKIAPYIEKVQTNLAENLKLKNDCVSVKATTNEKLGFSGREEGAQAFAVVLLKQTKVN
ncbi:MAG: 2-C-methyl-D-erythritol 2,4-cyclodiphosphate synthase [Calditrichaeota bacterium]|nr:MAG: 2-C-methyl-D-erythritol 2,4-cyclodiphosphate synthase [Calditrichota bacterium]